MHENANDVALSIFPASRRGFGCQPNLRYHYSTIALTLVLQQNLLVSVVRYEK